MPVDLSALRTPADLAEGSPRTEKDLSTMARAVWNGTVVAESDHTEYLEGNHYFPRESIVSAHFEPSARTTVCGWKGTANYFHLVVDGERNENAAWVYEETKPAAKAIEGHIAFYGSVQVET